MEMTVRPRRLRKNDTLRRMVRETRMDKSSLIYPIFVREGENMEEEIPSMEGQFRYSIDRLPYALEGLMNAGADKVMWKMMQRWSFWQRQPCPTWRQGLIWWHLQI